MKDRQRHPDLIEDAIAEVALVRDGRFRESSDGTTMLGRFERLALSMKEIRVNALLLRDIHRQDAHGGVEFAPCSVCAIWRLLFAEFST